MNSSNSEVLNMGFADFVKDYQRRCKDEGGDEPKLEKETQKSEKGSSSGEISIKTVSLTSIAPQPATSQTKPGVDDAGFIRFLDEWTCKASKEAKLHWKKMSKNQRAMFAPRDDIKSCKRKSPQSKKCLNPKGVGKGSKCPKPKSEKKCPKPKSEKMCRKPTPKSEFPKC